jgi:hypothetical protein
MTSSGMTSSHHSRMWGVALLGLAAVALAGCGGAGSKPSPAVSASHASLPEHNVVLAGHVRAPLGGSRDAVHRSGVVLVAHGHDSEPGGSGAVPQVRPCTLVNAGEAQAIIGKPIARAVEAPQGPTCIYVPRGRGREVTLAVGPMSFRQARAQLSSAIALKIGGHGAVCGAIGTPVTLVPLSLGRVMTVSAPCPIAASIAKQALTRLSGA